MIKILVISLEAETVKNIRQFLAADEYEIFWVSPEEDCISRIKDIRPRVVILERGQRLNEAFERLRKIKEYDQLLEVIILGLPERETRIAEVIRAGALDYLEQPLKVEALVESLRKLGEKISIRQETYHLERELTGKYLFEGMVGRHPAMLEIFSMIERLAKHQITVLITGETGTGKELAARAIHHLSVRSQRPWVVVDCTSLPESLFESEVFGYERGAFTGADRQKAGLLKEADGGTIFFDEISEMPMTSQAKLLRFLSEGTFRPLGSNRSVKVNTRVICSTNRNLREEVRAGRFREDLFHRINVAEINIPALRKRKEDISLLCYYFIDRYNGRYGKAVRGISNRVKKILFEYDWPGNIRELEKVIERAVTLTTENFIDVQHLPEELLNKVNKIEQSEGEDEPYPYGHLTLAEIEKKHLLEVLKAANFNKQKAASLLGITRQALYRKLSKYGISV
ncbi:MAG: sigma-54 dependent transcriptional regulator [Acidobacteriota bacterium]|nr:sigma-54 dependent transcriptional regulator [Acidobacteriota bacterium]